MLSSLKAGFSQQRVLALGGALGVGGLASVWLVSVPSKLHTCRHLHCSIRLMCSLHGSARVARLRHATDMLSQNATHEVHPY